MKAMIYKTLSTVVDDFFAFCIRMPILHRLACFRDDVIFLIFLYQVSLYSAMFDVYIQPIISFTSPVPGSRRHPSKSSLTLLFSVGFTG